ncbi:DUF3500 domain-containing protein [Streptomyces sp. BYX5S]
MDPTYFYWPGGTKDFSAVYYRVHSPVVLIAYDATHHSATAATTGSISSSSFWRPITDGLTRPQSVGGSGSGTGP